MTTTPPQALSSSNLVGQKEIWSTKECDYEFDKQADLIGRGSTALVYLASCTANKKNCAIKIIDLELHPNDEDFRKEIQLMSSCNHENIVSYYSCFVVKRSLWLVMAILDAGSLLDIIKFKVANKPDIFSTSDGGVFSEVQQATLLREVAKGLQYLHNIGHIHRDIKSGNILLSMEGDVRIADFGVSAVLNMQSRNAKRTTFVGTPCWMAPEVMDHDSPGYDSKADIWSFGITAIELAIGQAPYHQMQPLKVILMTLQNPPPKLESVAPTRKFSKDFRKLVESCLQKDPKSRITAALLLKDAFLKKAKGIECIRLITQTIPNLQT